MRTLDRSFCALLLAFGVARTASAEEVAAKLEVERSPEASDCPDASVLARRLEVVRGRAPGAREAAYRVEFTREGGVFQATIRAGDGSSRVIESRSRGCASLAEASAVTLALLLDGETPAPSPSPRARVVRAPVARTYSAPRQRSTDRVRLSLGAGALFGVTSPVAMAVLGEAGLQIGRFRAGLGGLWAVPRTLSLGPGHVRELLLSGTARGCFALSQAAGRLDFCSGLYAGAQRAEAAGFASNAGRTRNWLAIPVELDFSEEFGVLGLEFAAAALLPLVRNEFTVDGQGAAYSATSVSGLLAVRAYAPLPW